MRKSGFAQRAGSLDASGREQLSSPRWAQLPYLIVLAVTAGGLAWAGLAADHVRAGTLAMACAVLAAALVRLMLPERMAGMLVSRGRVIDVGMLAGLGTCILVAALVLPPPS